MDQSGAVAAFYRSRGGAPLWFAPRAGAAAQQLVQLLATSSADNLDPRRYQAQRLARAVQAAQSGNPAAVQQAEAMLSTAFVQYVRDLKHDPGMGIIYVDSELRPTPPSAATILSQAANLSTPRRLRQAIESFVVVHNQQAAPFEWIKVLAPTG